MSSGAEINNPRHWFIVCVRALTVLRRATETIRMVSAAPDCNLGIAQALPDKNHSSSTFSVGWIWLVTKTAHWTVRSTNFYNLEALFRKNMLGLHRRSPCLQFLLVVCNQKIETRFNNCWYPVLLVSIDKLPRYFPNSLIITPTYLSKVGINTKL